MFADFILKEMTSNRTVHESLANKLDKLRKNSNTSYKVYLFNNSSENLRIKKKTFIIFNRKYVTLLDLACRVKSTVRIELKKKDKLLARFSNNDCHDKFNNQKN